MRKHYRKLTKEQKERGVIFSSQLMPGGSLHEVLRPLDWSNSDAWEPVEAQIKRLKDDKFFNDSPFKYNEMRE